MALDLDEFDSDSAEIRGDLPATVTFNSVNYTTGTVSTAPKMKEMQDAGFLVGADLIWVINRSAFSGTAPDVNNEAIYSGTTYRIVSREDLRMAADTKYGLKRQT
jgi:hypothetical protein